MTKRKYPVLCIASGLLLFGGCASQSHRSHLADRPRHEAQPTESAASRLLVISAVYGSGDKFADVTYRVNDLLRDQDAVFWAKPQWLGADPTPGWNKALVIVYESDGRRKTFSTGEGAEVSVARLLGNARPDKKKAKQTTKPKPKPPTRKATPASEAKAKHAVVWPTLEVLENSPSPRLFVEVRGPNFAKKGYVLWTEGLRVEAVEAAAGYVSDGAPLIEMRILRDGKCIYSEIGPLRRMTRFDSMVPVPPRAKPDAPLLQPGDQVFAHELMG